MERSVSGNVNSARNSMPTMNRSQSNNTNILQPTKPEGIKLVMTQSGLDFCKAEKDARN